MRPHAASRSANTRRQLGPATIGALGLGLLCTIAGCEDATAPATAANDVQAPAEFVDTSFAETYRIFLRRNLSTQEKTMLWSSRFKGRWVRWTGAFVGFSPAGLKMRHLQPTATFDVSVIVNEPQRSQLRKLLQTGKFYAYTGRLDKYDDLFRTFYLDQGAVLNPTPDGVRGEFIPRPPPLRILPAEKAGDAPSNDEPATRPSSGTGSEDRSDARPDSKSEVPPHAHVHVHTPSHPHQPASVAAPPPPVSPAPAPARPDPARPQDPGENKSAGGPNRP